MINASKEFKEKLKNGANLVNYADITLSDGTVLNLTYKDFMIGGCQIEDKTTDGKFGVGFCVGKTLSMRIANHEEQFSQYDFYNSIINLYVAMQLDDGSIEKIRKGVYYTILPETPGDIIEISAVDGIYQLDKDYSASTTAYPATLQTIISDACLDCAIPIGFTQFDNMNFVVQEKPEKATYRQIVSWACQIAGYNAHIDNNGYMQLVWYNSALLEQYNYVGGNFKTYPHDTVINGGNFTDYSADTIISGGNFTDPMPEHIFRIKSLSVSTDDVQITGVKVVGENDGENETFALFGEEGYLIEITENPFVLGKEQEVADYLGARIVGMVFRPFSAEILNNPLYEPFDVVRVSDRKGNVYLSILNSISYTVGSYTQISCEAEDPVRNGSSYASPAAQAVVEARRNTERQLTTYDKAVQNMNQLAANAMGLYRESEKQPDGSYIYYQSNKPITIDEDGKCHFEDNSVVYKSAAEGFFVSTDGGESFTSGFDSQGNAVVNVLSSIGITFDWAKGGTLTLGGIDNQNGVLKILDKNREQIGYWSKDGFIVKNKYFAVTQDGKIYSNNPTFGDVIFMTPTVSQSSDITVSAMESRKDLVMQLIQSYSSSLGAYSTLNIGNNSDSIEDYAPVGRVRIRSSNYDKDALEFEIYAKMIAYGSFRLYNAETTSSGTSAVFDKTNYLYKESSSSERYKNICREMNAQDVINLYNIQPAWAKYKQDYLPQKDERYNVEYPMFIAENVEKYAPLAVDHNEEGQPENWNHRVMIPYMFQMIKSQKEEINNLTKRLERLESMMLKGVE